MSFAIYVINLDRNPERFDAMRRQFDQLGLDAIRVPAVDGKALAEDDIRRFRRERPAERDWTPGAIGCFLSHESAWRMIVSSEHEFGAVFEDDMSLSIHLADILPQLHGAVSQVDLIRLEGTSHRMRVGNVARFEAGPFSLFEVKSESWCAGGYVLGKATASRLLRAPVSGHMVADRYLFHKTESAVAAKLQIMQMIPALCVQTKYHPRPVSIFESEIEHESVVERLVLYPWWKVKGAVNVLRGYRRIPFAPDILEGGA